MWGVFLAFVLSLTFLILGASSKKLHYYFYPPNKLNKIELMDGIPIMQRMTEIGWTNCLKKLNYQADIVFYGNSITRGSCFQYYFKDKKVCNLGLAGDNLDGLLRRIDMVVAVHPKKVFFMGGINGSKEIPIDVFFLKYLLVVQALKDSLPNTDIYLQSILPVNHRVYARYADNRKIEQMNKVIQLIAKQEGVVYLDLFTAYYKNAEMPDSLTRDGIHLLQQHYDRWADIIRPFVYM